MKNFNVSDLIAISLLAIGGINWGIIGAFNIDLVSYLFGNMTVITRAVYVLIGLSAIYVLFSVMFESNTSTVNRVVLQSR